jgi:phosphoadenosine phosphosulfate reductase
MHQVLITEPARHAHQRHGDGELWGIRAQESRGRRIMLLKALAAAIATDCGGCCPTPDSGRSHTARQRARHGGSVHRADRTVAFSPVWDWTAADIFSHLARHHVPVNPVYSKLRELGAPAFLQRVSPAVDANSLGYGRIVWLRHGWPPLFEQIRKALPRLAEFL